MEPTVSGVGVLDKSVAVLGAVAASTGPSSLRDLVEATGLPKPTVHRLAGALEAHGLVRRDRGGYVLGRRLVELGRRAAADWPLAETARPVLERLRDDTGESVQLYVREDDERVCVVSLESPHELRTIVEEGARLSLEVGSAGRILRAGDPQPGWTASVEERAIGVASVSAPVIVDGVVVAAVGISGPLGRLGADPGGRYGGAVAAAADQIGALVAGEPIAVVSPATPR